MSVVKVRGDGIVKAWKAMDEAVDAIRKALQKCNMAAGLINCTTSAAKNEIRNHWRHRALILSEMIDQITGR